MMLKDGEDLISIFNEDGLRVPRRVQVQYFHPSAVDASSAERRAFCVGFSCSAPVCFTIIWPQGSESHFLLDSGFLSPYTD